MKSGRTNIFQPHFNSLQCKKIIFFYKVFILLYISIHFSMNIKIGHYVAEVDDIHYIVIDAIASLTEFY